MSEVVSCAGYSIPQSYLKHTARLLTKLFHVAVKIMPTLRQRLMTCPCNLPVSHLSSTKATCSPDGRVHDSFGVAAGLSIRQQWVNAFPATLVEKIPHLPVLSALAAAGRQATHGSSYCERQDSKLGHNTCNAAAWVF